MILEIQSQAHVDLLQSNYWYPSSQFFAEAGFPCPRRRNPSDHFLRCINSDFDAITATLKGSQKIRVCITSNCNLLTWYFELHFLITCYLYQCWRCLWVKDFISQMLNIFWQAVSGSSPKTKREKKVGSLVCQFTGKWGIEYSNRMIISQHSHTVTSGIFLLFSESSKWFGKKVHSRHPKTTTF